MKIYTKSREQQVYEHLLDEITTGVKPANSRLSGVRSLAKQYGVSVFTVQKALARLEEKDLIEKRHGSGSYVKEVYRPQTTADNVLLYMRAHGDVFADTVSGLCGILHQQGKLPLVINSGERDAEDVFRKVAFSDVKFLVIDANKKFPFELLQMSSLKEKIIIGIFQWESSVMPKNTYRVLCDWECGCRQAADHLWRAGHRTVILAESYGHAEQLRSGQTSEKEQIANSPRGYFFMKAWQEYGGDVVVTETRGRAEENRVIEPATVLSALTARNPATAVYGTRDLDVWSTCRLISTQVPELLDRIEFMGWGNTPWSRLSETPISTLDWNVHEIVRKVGDIIQQKCSGEKTGCQDRLFQIKPKLVIRMRKQVRTHH